MGPMSMYYMFIYMPKSPLPGVYVSVYISLDIYADETPSPGAAGRCAGSRRCCGGRYLVMLLSQEHHIYHM